MDFKGQGTCTFKDFFQGPKIGILSSFLFKVLQGSITRSFKIVASLCWTSKDKKGLKGIIFQDPSKTYKRGCFEDIY